ncbi:MULTISPECIES: CusA/CzcA family heavy metal efflux RND transporter [Caulobacter]|jgi:cobalt-zinc-cadmium resistance protein CzcA|uniref:Heavy metal efflux pump, cobalt-zinc-cadmium n=1 Tax=Caulobacter vibrioides OR37 TaxID=1292034 RepID=R0CZ71_CAUVI|nr:MULTISPECIES: CusA/CzcA family heavy metal efflux RND transporter [Caulobacter]ENZ81736.1 heavy metal efflux pump, cobalt-zinc-cadmium [Caulobacter vibrioides OR37]MBQ1561112.1 CusA/CzcA family heavy metal efflux RND transporter [Caulobacter sp.]
MIGRVLDLSVRFRWAVIALVALVAALGVHNLASLPIDAVPDITNKQVQINTVAGTLAPAEVEKLVTFPVETAMAGVPGLESTRSISRNGFSQVTVVFKEKTDIYFARQQVAERLTQVRQSLPAGVEPAMGPISSGLGEVLMWTVAFEHPGGKGAKRQDGAPGWQTDGAYLTTTGERLADPTAQAAYLREVQDWIVRPGMRAVPGVAGVDSIGGFDKQFVVQPDPIRMASLGVSFGDLAKGLEAANLAVGAGFVERGGEAFLVRADARVRTVDEIANAIVAAREGVSVRVRDVAVVKVGGGLRGGAASENGEEVVVGTALMRTGENSRAVAVASAEQLTRIAERLPPGIKLQITYDRSKLVGATIRTVEKNLTEGALLVVVVLFLLLGNFRAALITALVIPLSMLMTAIGMNRLGVSGNLMSLGALDFGLIVDGAVIIVENALRRLAERQGHEGRLLTLPERLSETREAAREMIAPTVYGQAIILLVYAPLLTFTGVEGKTFSPMAITVMLALASAFALSLTFIPAMIALLIRGRVAEKEVAPVRWAKARYEPLLRKVVARPLPVILGSVGVFVAAVATFALLGREFTPQLDEKDLAIQALRIPSTSLEQSLRMQRRIERVIAGFPEVAFVYSKTGASEVASDPMPPNASDAFVILKPRKDWPDKLETKAQLIGRIEAKLEGLTGNAYEFSQPIQMRFNELIAGVRGDVAVKVHGDDLDAMAKSAEEIAAVLRGVKGAADVKVEQTSGFPTLDVQLDREAIGRHGLTVEAVADTLAVAMGGRQAGLVFQGDRRFDIVVRLPDASRNDLDAVGALPVIPPGGGGTRAAIPLRDLAKFSYSEGLNQVGRENGKRRVVVQANVRGADLGGFVDEARREVEARVKLPPGSWLVWGGQFENLKAAQARLALVAPLCFLLIFGLLFMALGGAAPAAAVFSAIPLALAGGVFGLALRGLPFSVSAAVGFIALSGVAVLNGLVMMTAIRRRLSAGMTLETAIIEGAVERLRPVMMTGLVASLGFAPMALATGAGAEVQRPLATVVIGGLITATALTLFVLPAICRFLPRGKTPA